MTTLSEMRLRRLNDELDRCSPVAFANAADAQVLAAPWLARPRRGMLTPYHVKSQTFKIEPGWCEYHEVTFGGYSLRQMEPQSWPIGTRLYVECVMLWEVDEGEINGTTQIFYKTGVYSIRSATIKDSPVDLATSEGPAGATSTDKDEFRHNWVRRFHIGTIADEAVLPGDGGGPIFPASFPFPFDLGTLNAF